MADLDPPREDRVLLVEGQDDKHVVLHLCRRSRPMPLFDIRDKGDINSLLDSVGPEIKAPGRIAVGILPVANDDPDARWNALQYRLAEQSLDLPQHREPNGTIIGGSPRVGIWLWPDNRGPGELEDFVEAMIPRDDGVWPLAQAYVDGIPEAERRFPPGKTLKAQLHAWLATRRTPGRMGSAIGTGDLEVDRSGDQQVRGGQDAALLGRLVGLGKALDVSLDFLMSAQIEALDAVAFRKHSGASARDRARAEAVVMDSLERYLAIEHILDIEPSVDWVERRRCDSVASESQIDERADELRCVWDLGRDPIPSLCELLEDKGIKVVEVDLPESINGLSCHVLCGGETVAEAVVVSSRINVERKRFTLAHELAHTVRHPHRYGDPVPSPKLWKQNRRRTPCLKRPTCSIASPFARTSSAASRSSATCESPWSMSWPIWQQGGP